MKQFCNFFVALATGLSCGYATADCQLETPISIQGKSVLETQQSKMITLEHVVFDRAYKTEMIPPVSSIANMQVKIFEITWSPTPFGQQKPTTGWMGAAFGPENGLAMAGFSASYGGQFDFEGSIQTTGDSSIFNTTETSKWNQGTTAATLTVQGDAIIGLEITVPVREKTRLDGGGFIYKYVGEDETLCVKSASLVKNDR